MALAQIALNRFGLGARAGEAPPQDGKRWLLDQLSRYDPAPAALASLEKTPALIGKLADLREDRRERKQEGAGDETLRRRQRADNPPAMEAATDSMAAAPANRPASSPEAQMLKPLRESYVAAVAARTHLASSTSAPFTERLVAFWANHFAVSIDKAAVLGLAGAFENEAIRPHVMGTFHQMLTAAVQHPAMLLYLDQAQSIGPNSKLAEFAERRGAKRQPGLNENLAREIMELHTLGVRSGYTQADVTEFARAMTGMTVSGLGRIARLIPGDVGRSVFVTQMHEPGTRTVMGKRYDQSEEKQAAAILATLAAHPATARHIATKLARHFASDDPPPALVTRLEQAFLSRGGDLPTLYRVLIDAPEVWAAPSPKFRQPWEWLVAVQRATGITFPAQPLVFSLTQLGQPLWKPGSPAGWDDLAASWAAPDALLRRVELANRYAQRVPASDVRELAGRLFPDALSEVTRQSIARAEGASQALALLLVSPEMLRR